MNPVRVGLVGAGPWAGMFHAPMLAAGPETTLAVVYARRIEAARELAERFGTHATDDFDEFLGRCDAVAFAVPPDVQARLAPLAAAAGKPLLLEKPLALSVTAAQQMVDAIDQAGVPTQLMLTLRYTARIRQFLDQARQFDAFGARAAWISGAFLPGSPFSTPWRLEYGALLDVGPHVLDLLDAALGPIRSTSVLGDPHTWVAVTAVHEGGAVSDVAVSSVVPGFVWECSLFGPAGELHAPQAGEDETAEVQPVIAAEFAQVVRSGRSHELDAHRGLFLQRLLRHAAPPNGARAQ
ncbi:MAG: Gfo/Idh/MocA family oxidoreductase [Candidatus Nanopelagicales bacterium]